MNIYIDRSDEDESRLELRFESTTKEEDRLIRAFFSNIPPNHRRVCFSTAEEANMIEVVS